MLIKAGAGVDVRDARDHETNATALGEALFDWRCDPSPAVRLLLGAGANASGVVESHHLGPLGATRVAIGSVYATVDLVRTLVHAEGRRVFAPDQHGVTVLHEAAMKGDEAILDLVVSLWTSEGADVDSEDADGLTPLMYAAAEDKIGVFKALVKAGALHDYVSSHDRSAMQVAAEKASRDVYGYLRDVHKANETAFMIDPKGDRKTIKRVMEDGIVKQSADEMHAKLRETMRQKYPEQMKDPRYKIQEKTTYSREEVTMGEHMRRLEGNDVDGIKFNPGERFGGEDDAQEEDLGTEKDRDEL